MQTKTKSIIILAGTLIIGILIGLFAGAYFRQTVIADRMSGLRSQDRFIRMHERLIEPTADQREAVERILREQHEKVLSWSTDLRERIKASEDSLIEALEPVLSDEQLEMFKQRLEERQRFHRDRRDRDHHPRRPDRRPPV